jgi:ketopantoate reductase
MLTEFDQNTIANMTAALDHVCKKIPADRDSSELRKKISDELIQCARSGKRTLIELQNAGLKTLKAKAEPTFNWFGLRRFYSR